MRLEDHALESTVGEVEVLVERRHRGADGVFLVAQLSFPSLHLGLDGGSEDSFRRSDNPRLTVGDTPYTARHYLSARDYAQASAFGRAWLRDSWREQGNVRLEDLSDEGLWLARRDGGQSLASLRRFAQNALALAARLPEARKSIPAPASMQTAVPAWRELAKLLGGKLELARMATKGRYQGAEVSVQTCWSAAGKAEETDITVAAGELNEEMYLTWSRDGDYRRGGTGGLTRPAREAVEALQMHAIEVRIDKTRVRVALPAPQLDTGLVLEHIEALAKLARVLQGHTGPYR
jgi:hypothetical protein